MTIILPPGWSPSSLERRFVTAEPSSLDESTRSVSAILSTGGAVQRFYGTEILTISKYAVDVSRVQSGKCSLIDSHQSTGISSVLGRVAETWIKGGALWGRLVFGLTPQADLAWGMVQRNELSGVSIGYRVTEWSVTDEDGEIIDQQYAYANAASFTYRAERWELLEASLVSVGADAGAGIRSGIADDNLDNVRARMLARQNMSDRQSAMLNPLGS
jgi:hypothetical protein